MSKSRRNAITATSSHTTPKEGKVVHDLRGNAVWDWAIETDVLATKTTADLLSTLNGTGRFKLELEGADAPDAGGAPYNRQTD
jgi:hypothetical protein